MPSSQNKKETKKKATKKTNVTTPPPKTSSSKKTTTNRLFPWLSGAAACFLITCFTAVCCSCVFSAGSSSGQVSGNNGFDILASGMKPPAPPSEFPATMLSMSLASCAMYFSIILAVVLLTRQRRFYETELSKAHARLYEAIRKYEAAKNDAAVRDRKARWKYQQKMREYKAYMAWIDSPLEDPVYTKVEKLVLLGRVLSSEMSLEDAFKECNKLGSASHIQYNRVKNTAVLKTFTEMPDGFGNPDKDTVDTLTKKVGEGYHPDMDVYVHPRFYLLNNIGAAVDPSFKPILPNDLVEAQKVSQKQRDEYNEGCRMGSNKHCYWTRFKGMFFVLLEILFAFIGVFLPPFFGTGFLVSLLGEVAIGGVEAALTIGIPKALNDQQLRDAKSIKERLETLRKGGMLSNMYIGGKNSFMAIQEALFSTDCVVEGSGDYCIRPQRKLVDSLPKPSDRARDYSDLSCHEEKNLSKNKDPKNGLPIGAVTKSCARYFPEVSAARNRLLRYEDIQDVDEWNCSEVDRKYVWMHYGMGNNTCQRAYGHDDLIQVTDSDCAAQMAKYLAENH